MTNVLVWSNDAASNLASPINSSATTINLTTGSGALFPTPGAGQYFVGSLVDVLTGANTEIVWVTGRSGDTLTVQRAQEGTTAQSWLAGDIFSNFITAGQLSQFVQTPQLNQVSSIVYAGTDSGSANSMVIATAVSVASLTTGMQINVIPAFTNTTGAVANVNSIGSRSITRLDGSALLPGDMLAGVMGSMIYTGTAWTWQNLSPQAQYKASGTTVTASTSLITLTSAAIGGAVLLNASASQSATLPATSGLPVGSTLTIIKTGSGTATIGSNGASANINNGSATLASSVVMNTGEQTTFTWTGTLWIAMGTFMARNTVASLAQSLTTVGYQYFQGGLIMQWGVLNSTLTNVTDYPITFPVTYPNACLSVAALQIFPTNFPNENCFSSKNISVSGFTLNTSFQLSNTSELNSGWNWMAIGW